MHPCPCRCAEIGDGARLVASKGPASPAALRGHFPSTCYPTRGRSGTTIGREGRQKPGRACCPERYLCGAGTGTVHSERFAGTLRAFRPPAGSHRRCGFWPSSSSQRGRRGQCRWKSARVPECRQSCLAVRAVPRVGWIRDCAPTQDGRWRRRCCCSAHWISQGSTDPADGSTTGRLARRQCDTRPQGSPGAVVRSLRSDTPPLVRSEVDGLARPP